MPAPSAKGPPSSGRPIRELLDLGDRVALITGATRGIGRGIAERVALAGARVMIDYRSDDARAEEVRDLLRAEGIWYPELETIWPEGVARFLARAPLARLRAPHEVADACLFLLSPASSFITGAVLAVDGGVSSAPAF